MKRLLKTLTLSFILLSILALTGCVQGPVSKEVVNATALPTISSSSPISSAITMALSDAAQNFTVEVEDSANLNFRVFWKVNGLISHASNDQLIYSLDPSVVGLSNGVAHTVQALIYDSNGSELLSNRSWYITVIPDVSVTSYSPSSTSIKAIHGQALSTSVLNSTTATWSVGGLGIDNISLTVSSNNHTCSTLLNVKYSVENEVGVMVQVQETQHSDAIVKLPTSAVMSLTNADITDSTPAESRKIEAVVTRVRDDNCDPLATPLAIETRTWNVLLHTDNTSPVLTTPLPAQAYTATQDSSIVLGGTFTDSDSSPGQVAIKYEIRNLGDATPTWEVLDGSVTGITQTANCTALTMSQTCDISIDSFMVGPSTVNASTYEVRAIMTASDSVYATGASRQNTFTWTITTTEKQDQIGISYTAAAKSVDEATIHSFETMFPDISITDLQRDDYYITIEAVGKSVPIQRYPAAPGTYTSHTLSSNDGIQALTGLSYTFDEDLVTSGANEIIDFKITVYDNPDSKAPTSAAITIPITVSNKNPAPTVAASAAPLTGQATSYEVQTGFPFTIQTSNAVDTSIADGEGIYYNWEMRTGVADCTDTAWTPIPDAQKLTGTAIDQATSGVDMKLVWTPPPGPSVYACFRLCVGDDGSIGDGADPKNDASLCTSTLEYSGSGAALNKFVKIVPPEEQTATASGYDEVDVYFDNATNISYTAYTIGTNLYISKTTYTGKTRTRVTGAAIPTLDAGLSTITPGELSITKEVGGSKLIVAYSGISSGPPLTKVGVVYLIDTADLSTVSRQINLTQTVVTMGRIEADATGWYLPYIGSNTDQVYVDYDDITNGTTCNANVTIPCSVLLTTPSTSNKLVANSSFNDGANDYLVISVKKSDNTWSLYQHQMNTAAFSATPSLTGDIFSSSTDIDQLNLGVGDSAGNPYIYASGVSNSDSRIAAAKVSITDYSSPIATSSLVVGSPTESLFTQNVQAVRVTPGTSNHEVLIGVMSSLNNIYMLKVNAQTAIDTSSTTLSFNLNKTGVPATNLDFYISPITENYVVGNDGSISNESERDSIILVYEDTAVNITDAIINIESNTTPQQNESTVGWHPGYF